MATIDVDYIQQIINESLTSLGNTVWNIPAGTGVIPSIFDQLWRTEFIFFLFFIAGMGGLYIALTRN